MNSEKRRISSVPTNIITGFIRAENAGAGFRSIGWRVTPTMLFDHRMLVSLLAGITVQRMKAVLITDGGIFGYNLTLYALTEMAMDDAIEIIAEDIDYSWERGLLACLIPNP